jgi:protein gp37
MAQKFTSWGDFSVIHKSKKYTAILSKKQFPAGSDIFLGTVMDFFHTDADQYRAELWDMVRERSDLTFMIITKRIERFNVNLPADWPTAYPHVRIACTAETQKMADTRLPFFLEANIPNRQIVCEPLLEAIDLSPYLKKGKVLQVVAGGENGRQKTIRPCQYELAKSLRDQCKKAKVAYWFKQTGTRWIDKDGEAHYINTHAAMFEIAQNLGLDV